MATNVPMSSGPQLVSQNENTIDNVMSDITRFMLRKDVLLSRFSNFNDTRKALMSWKAPFQSIVRELGISPFEEMDLLVK